jgi:hypothetical protein
MSSVQKEIAALEERLRLAELGPDPKFYEDALADDAVLVSQDGQPSMAKSKVIEAHQPGKGPITWRRNGLTYTAVADLSPDDLKLLRDAFLHA